MGRGLLGRVMVVLAALVVIAATIDDAAARDRRHGGGGGRSWSRGGGGHHHHRHVPFRSFVFLGGGSYAFGRPAPVYYPAYTPPPVYVSKDDDCYNTVPRSPGLADLYTCGNVYIGPISVP